MFRFLLQFTICTPKPWVSTLYFTHSVLGYYNYGIEESAPARGLAFVELFSALGALSLVPWRQSGRQSAEKVANSRDSPAHTTYNSK